MGDAHARYVVGWFLHTWEGFDTGDMSTAEVFEEQVISFT